MQRFFLKRQSHYKSSSSCCLSWGIGTGRSCPTFRNASTIARQWLNLNDSFRGNPDRRPVGSAAQTDDRFVAMSSRVCISALSSTAAQRVQKRAKADVRFPAGRLTTFGPSANCRVVAPSDSCQSLVRSPAKDLNGFLMAHCGTGMAVPPLCDTGTISKFNNTMGLSVALLTVWLMSPVS